MSTEEFEDWKYFLEHELEVYRSPQLQVLREIQFELAANRYILAGFPFSPVKKMPAPIYEQYLPTRLRSEQILPEHVKMRRKLSPEEFEKYRKEFIARKHQMWQTALGLNIDGKTNGK